MSNGFLSDQFNFDPADNKETTASYTVPAGMYAIVSVTLSVNAYGSVTGNVTNNDNPLTTSDSNSVSLELRLKSGSIITKSESPANASNNNDSGTTGYLVTIATSSASVLVDGASVSTVKCSAYSSVNDNDTSSGFSHFAQVLGSANVEWHIAEYNKQGA